MVARTLAGYAEFWRHRGFTPEEVRRFGGAVGERIADWAPQAWAELTALADSAALPAEEVFALTGRTELLARAAALGTAHGSAAAGSSTAAGSAAGSGAPSECSTVAVVDARGARSAQTWDWYPELARDGVIRHRTLFSPDQPPHGELTAFTEPGMLAKIGQTGRLGLHFNILSHRLDGGGSLTDVGVPVHVVAQEVLTRATDLAGAEAIAASATLSASTVLTVVTSSEAGCLELSPAGVRTVLPEQVGPGGGQAGEVRPGQEQAVAGFLWHTNHFRHPDLVPDDTAEKDGTTWARGEFLMAQRDKLLAAEDAAGLLAAMCHRPVWVEHDAALAPFERSTTMLTAAFDYPAAGATGARFGPGAL